MLGFNTSFMLLFCIHYISNVYCTVQPNGCKVSDRVCVYHYSCYCTEMLSAAAVHCGKQ